MIVLHVSEYSIYQGNQSRNYKVPKDAVCSQIESLEWIEDSEAHTISFYQEDILIFEVHVILIPLAIEKLNKT